MRLHVPCNNEVWYITPSLYNVTQVPSQIPFGGVPMANYGEMANCAVVLGPIRHKNLRHNSP